MTPAGGSREYDAAVIRILPIAHHSFELYDGGSVFNGIVSTGHHMACIGSLPQVSLV